MSGFNNRISLIMMVAGMSGLPMQVMFVVIVMLAAAGCAGNDRLYENRHRKAEADQFVKPLSHPEILAVKKSI